MDFMMHVYHLQKLMCQVSLYMYTSNVAVVAASVTMGMWQVM